MLNSLAISIFLLAFFASITFNGFFRNVAKRNNLLIDIPDKSRHFHFRPTPLTGGLGIFFGIVVTGLLLTGLTDAKYSIDLRTGFLGNTSLNDGSINKSFEVNNEDYNLSLKQDENSKSIFVQIDKSGLDSNNLPPTINIIPIDKNKFKVILPSGVEKFYLSEGNKIIEVGLKNDLILETFIPQNTDSERINLNNFSISLYICALFIMIFMIFDDYYGIKATYRLTFQSLVVLMMIIMTNEYLVNLGNLFGFGDINLGVLSIPITIFCVVGLMNAFNMIDGLNGICASLALIPLIFVTYFGNFSYGLLVPIGAMLGFLAYNLGYLGKKRRVFLGDSGSNMLGFAVAFVCVEYSQNLNHSSYINPVTALWLVAIPLVDCITVLISRILKGVMPFKPGRDHLHHKLLNLGIKPKKILIIFILLSVCMSIIGYSFEKLFPSQEYISFYAFLLISTIYYLTIKKGFKYNV